MRKIEKSAWAEVRLDRIAWNLSLVRSQLKPATKVCGLLKADAYGHGLFGMYDSLLKSGLVDMVAVGRMSELLQVFSYKVPEGFSHMDVLLLGDFRIHEIEEASLEGLIDPDKAILSIYNMTQLRELEALGRRTGLRFRLHIRIDGWNSGMGFGFQEFFDNEEELFHASYVDICGLYSHLYTSYSNDLEAIRNELERFDRFVKGISPDHRKRLTVHIKNSSLIFLFFGLLF
jgi:alanine racemase